MAFRLNDADTEQFVISRGLLSPERLAPFRIQCSVDSSCLFDLMVGEGVITPEMLAELEKNAPPPAAPRSIRAPGTGFLQPRQSTSGAPAISEATQGASGTPSGTFAAAANMAGPGGAGAGVRRPSRTRFFEDPPAVKPAATSSQSRPAVIAPPPSGHPPAMEVSHHQQTTATITLKPRRPQGWPGGIAPADAAPGHIQQWLASARAGGASDLFLSAGSSPMMRLHGELKPMGQQPVMSAEQVAGLARQLLTREQWEYLERNGDLSVGYAYAGGGRYRINLANHAAGCEIAAHIVADQLLPLEQLGLPEGVAKLTQFKDGLLIFAGTANSGKTTTMMAAVDLINRTRGGHVLTLEDPIEYVLVSQAAQVTQREIGAHTADYQAALHGALREDPDVIVIGELYDYKTTLAAIAAAEAGHLVLATVQAADCARAIDRLFECPDEPAQLRNMVADNVRAIFSQQMILRADGQGRVAAGELLINSISVANIIREAKTQNLVNVMQTGRSQGMIMMDDSLRTLVEDGVISGEEAHARCKNKAAFKQYLTETEEPAAAPPAAPEPQKAPPAPPRR